MYCGSGGNPINGLTIPSIEKVDGLYVFLLGADASSLGADVSIFGADPSLLGVDVSVFGAGASSLGVDRLSVSSFCASTREKRKKARIMNTAKEPFTKSTGKFLENACIN